jgi:hypothetical protein
MNYRFLAKVSQTCGELLGISKHLSESPVVAKRLYEIQESLWKEVQNYYNHQSQGDTDDTNSKRQEAAIHSNGDTPDIQ